MVLDVVPKVVQRLFCWAAHERHSSSSSAIAAKKPNDVLEEQSLFGVLLCVEALHFPATSSDLPFHQLQKQPPS